MTHYDATTADIAIPRSAGVTKADTTLLRAALRRMGVRNVHSVVVL